MGLKEESCSPRLRNVHFDDLLWLVANRGKGVAGPQGSRFADTAAGGAVLSEGSVN